MLHPVAPTGSRRFFVHAINALRADGMPIGELSRLRGVNIETIRYYEKIGMLPAPPRTESGVGFMGQKKRGYSSSSVAGGSWGSLSIKSAPCLLLAGRERRHAPRCGRSLNITSKTFPQRSTILLGLNACCVRRSRNALAGRHQIAPCWIFWMPKAPGLPAHSAVRAQARNPHRPHS